VTYTYAQGALATIDGVPVSQILQNAPSGNPTNSTSRGETRAYLANLQGFDLASGDAPDFPIVAGARDNGALGHNLSTADAGQNHVIVPQRASLAPLDLKLGDTLAYTGTGTSGQAPVTVTVVGFYDSTDLNAKTLAFASMLTDDAAAQQLAGGKASYVYALHLDPVTADQQLHELQKQVPGILTVSVGDLLLFITNLLNNLLVLLTAVMSLAVVAGLIIIANAVALAMLERRRELGILKATGFTSRSVLAEVLVEYAVVGFTGGLLAMLLVAVAMILLGNLLLQAALTVATLTVLEIVLATALVCMLIAAFVAWSATRVRPLEVLRYE
jgi:predicted lysophospholipase L1 biosynthesis ABC-type transport system permease subunit